MLIIKPGNRARPHGSADVAAASLTEFIQQVCGRFGYTVTAQQRATLAGGARA